MRRHSVNVCEPHFLYEITGDTWHIPSHLVMITVGCWTSQMLMCRTDSIVPFRSNLFCFTHLSIWCWMHVCVQFYMLLVIPLLCQYIMTFWKVCNVSVTTPASFGFPFAWCNCFQFLTSNPCLTLLVRWVSCMWHMVKYLQSNFQPVLILIQKISIDTK